MSAEVQAKIDELIAKNQALGAQIDALREQRRALNAEIAKLAGALKLAAAMESSPEIKHALVPGATVDVSAAEVLQAMLARTKQ